jgi:hypothetical protein
MGQSRGWIPELIGAGWGSFPPRTGSLPPRRRRGAEETQRNRGEIRGRVFLAGSNAEGAEIWMCCRGEGGCEGDASWKIRLCSGKVLELWGMLARPLFFAQWEVNCYRVVATVDLI